MIQIALHEPQIAPNTGNILRLISNIGAKLHLIEPLGFDLQEKKLRRAGLDYVDLTQVHQHPHYDAFRKAVDGHRIIACTTKDSTRHDEPAYCEDDILLFGSETAGLPDAILATFSAQHKVRIPMLASSRSLNLSNAVSVVSYEAWRQLKFTGALLS